MLHNNKNGRFKQSLMSLTEEILALVAHKTNFQSKLSGKGSITRCPAHEDKKASLSVSEGAGGKVLLNCFRGCSTQDICRAIGIEVRDLFPNNKRR